MVNNPNFYGQSTSGTPDQIEDGVDFPHTGIIKALSLGIGQSYAISGFNITVASATELSVSSGVIFRNGKKHSVAATSGNLTMNSNNTNGYHLLVANSATPPVLTLRYPTGYTDAPDKVAAYVDGDTIIAVLTYNGTSSVGVQYLTVNKTENSLSLGYDSSGYTETGTLTADADGITMTGLYKLDTLPTATVATDDKLILQDTDDSDKIKTATAQQIADLSEYTDFDTDFAAKTTDDLTEGSNLYYRDSRAVTAIQSSASIQLAGSLSVADGVIFNEAGADKDFRVETNNNANMLFIDGGNDKVGIGTGTVGTGALTVNGAVVTKGRVKENTTVDSFASPVYSVSITNDEVLIVDVAASVLPAPPNPVNITLPSVTGNEGRYFRIICINNPGGPDDVTLDVQSGDTLNNEILTGLTTPYSLTSGKVYDIHVLSGGINLLLTLN
jgi:hypothetical protein